MDVVGVDRVALVLADIQGAESALLTGAREAFAEGRVRFVVVSTHHHSISGSPLTHQHARETLTARGAHVIVEHSVGESFSGDGLVAASFDERDCDMRIEVSRARHVDSLFGELEYDLYGALRTMEEVTRQRVEANLAVGNERGRRSSLWTRIARRSDASKP